jgi:hypothetical protein
MNMDIIYLFLEAIVYLGEAIMFALVMILIGCWIIFPFVLLYKLFRKSFK